jgi:hypothetical protein
MGIILLDVLEWFFRGGVFHIRVDVYRAFLCRHLRGYEDIQICGRFSGYKIIIGFERVLEG